ncbi:MAG: type IV secretion system DNA-binding domain-containing protein [Alphaproteobacteria bacterium]|nr:type IV secretion system DNA-binding domain-containing protein [Alphaproteobacteria bacterium]
MALDRKRFGYGKRAIVRDIRPLYVRMGDALQLPTYSFTMFFLGCSALFIFPGAYLFGDLIFFIYLLFFWWLKTRDRKLPGKMPMGAKYKDTNNMTPGKDGTPEGILFIGNEKKTKQQVWYNNSDARTHILYLGTTGSGKTEGLKSFVTSALSWGSGFVYIDGKADTDLWSSLSSLVRRFGRDDDLLVLNYMTGNSDARAPSNTMNPFSSGSASYLTQMLISLMPEAEGDNAMWKERAVSLLSSLMPALTWKRDHQDFPMSVNSIRNYLNLNYIIKLSRDQVLPEKIRESLKGYLDTLPGYVDAAFDDEGKEKPMGPDQPMIDTTTVRQQHGYLTMQFTRALQSLGDDYGYIFDTQAADVDMVDVVLNRRILIVLIPALEKSGDETANLGKIIAATLKGMMGSTLGATLEGESSTVIENKPTHSSTPFMTVFDEVGYYTAQGMAVMAAQARSLGFCLVFSAQDLQAMEKRVKEEARSITANCNIKIFGKLQDPTQTREFFENHIGKDYIAKVSSLQLTGGMSTGSYADTNQASIETGTRADYDDLKDMKEGEAIVSFAMDVLEVNIFYSNPGHAKAMRVTRYLALPEPDETLIKNTAEITKLRDLMCHKDWTATKADVALPVPEEIQSLQEGYVLGARSYDDPIDHGIIALCDLHAKMHPVEAQEAIRTLNQPQKETTVAAAATTVQENNTPKPATVAPSVAKKQMQQEIQPQTKEPVSWNTLVQEETSVVTPPKKKLSDAVENILNEAGIALRKSLFKSTSNKGTPDAAE